MATLLADPSVTAVIFDVDGTLVDTNYLHAVAWGEAMRQHGHPVPMWVVHRAVGMGSDRLLDAVLPADRDRSADDAIRAAHGTLYATWWGRLNPVPGAAALLRACAGRGLRVVLSSSAQAAELAAMRAALDADDAVAGATSSGDVEQSKPAPDLVRAALDLAGSLPQDTVFVGDTVWDARACAQLEVPFIGVLTGGISLRELVDAGAQEIYRDPAELLERLNASDGAR
ncbi:HAD family hydrolase [Allostreptomyces psammosilenae]|uniref:Phosphoglycolate phosphatase-like HAD superfamily hydrolase n=1 Tax=Allostreptomyces psammosilenae TaxID=1892865 RepID=A0A853A0Z1_9ACTN|nr:HAD family hydrolase [Allostreptomyces psammosilenae]NYI04172.1 phosphoglycolate phosphatase-like HAD superfamily hydrolase [Allostreptomyces psammosilenae]